MAQDVKPWRQTPEIGANYPFKSWRTRVSNKEEYMMLLLDCYVSQISLS